MNKKEINDHRQLIREAVDAGIKDYLTTRKAKIPSFVAAHFSLRGALKLHRKAFGKDLYKSPLNILWLIPLTAVKVSSLLLKKIAAEKMVRRLDAFPTGFRTDLQKEIDWLIHTELLEIPYQQESRISTKDALLEAILQNRELAGIIEKYLIEIHKQSIDPDFRKALEKNLQQYANTRTAAAELAGNLITLASSYTAFHQALPGVLSSGSAVAALIAEKIAISKFWLGSTLGAWYYSLFPVTASTGLIIVSTAVLAASLGMITTFTGIVTDPLQAKLGWHQKRLEKLIDALGLQMLGSGDAQFDIKELYVARVFDILDVLITALQSR